MGVQWMALAAMSIAPALAAGNATGFPQKPIRLIVPFPAGSGPDNLARPVADDLSKILGQAVIVENRPGAAQSIGTSAVAKADADGYTLLYSISGPIVVNPYTMPDLPYDAEKDFVAVARVAQRPLILLANSTLPIKTLQDFVAYAKQQPAAPAYGTWGTGSSAHLAGETLKTATGMDLLHVPYKGASYNDLAGGQLALTFGEPGGAKTYIDNGKAVGLAVAGTRRSSILPDVPTFSEAGVPEVASFYGWHGVFAPAATPKDVVEKLSDAIVQVVGAPHIAAFIREQGGEPDAATTAEFTQSLTAERERWKAIVQAVGVAAPG